MADTRLLRAELESAHEGRQRNLARFAARVAQRPLMAVALVVLVACALAAVFAPLIAPYNPNATPRGQDLLGPSLQHLFGTDEFGRDLFSRAVFGLRVSFSVGLGAVAAGAVIGAGIGSVAGYVGGLLDAVLMRIVDSLLAVPAILLAIAIVAIWGAGVLTLIGAIALVNVPIMARLARAGFLGERHKEYVQAAASLGASGFRIGARYILPNIVAPLLVQAALAMGYSVLLEAGLSYLGLGIRPPQASLGSLLNASQRFMRDAIWYPLFPGVVLSALLLSLNALADTVNDLLNPSTRRR